MIEVTLRYQILPSADEDQYWEFICKTLPTVLEASGLVELRAHRDLMIPTYVRTTLVWESAGDWATFAESDKWREVLEGVRPFAENFDIHQWIPSPYLEEPLRP